MVRVHEARRDETQFKNELRGVLKILKWVAVKFLLMLFEPLEVSEVGGVHGGAEGKDLAGGKEAKMVEGKITQGKQAEDSKNDPRAHFFGFGGGNTAGKGNTEANGKDTQQTAKNAQQKTAQQTGKEGNKGNNGNNEPTPFDSFDSSTNGQTLFSLEANSVLADGRLYPSSDSKYDGLTFRARYIDVTNGRATEGKTNHQLLDLVKASRPEQREKYWKKYEENCGEKYYGEKCGKTQHMWKETPLSSSKFNDNGNLVIDPFAEMTWAEFLELWRWSKEEAAKNPRPECTPYHWHRNHKYHYPDVNVFHHLAELVGYNWPRSGH
jgi:hypothetical protein